MEYEPQFLEFYLRSVWYIVSRSIRTPPYRKALAVVYCHYYIVKVEEPYLTLVFGEEVLYRYRLRTPRYFVIPRKADSGIHTKILK